jgi:hypothetical protein
MPKQLVYMTTKSPLVLLAVCFALWFAAHSFFASVFVFFVGAAWIKRSISTALKPDANAIESKEPAATVAAAPIASAAPQAQSATPIKRQYAKSAVVIPFKTGTDN